MGLDIKEEFHKAFEAMNELIDSISFFTGEDAAQVYYKWVEKEKTKSENDSLLTKKYKGLKVKIKQITLKSNSKESDIVISLAIGLVELLLRYEIENKKMFVISIGVNG